MIAHVFPGSGITVFTVKRTPLWLWLEFAGQAKSWSEDQKKQAREMSRRGK